MKKYTLLLFYFALFLICSCGISAIDRINKELKKTTDGKMMIDVPERIRTRSGFNTFPKVRASLGLKSLEKGIDGFELRIWDESKWPRARLIIFQHSDKDWNARECIYKYEVTESLIPDSVTGKFATLNGPKSGWNSFINQLLDLDVLNLRDFESLPGYNLATDEGPILVEIGSNNYYRLYDLPGADWRAGRISDAGKIVKILSVVAENFQSK